MRDEQEISLFSVFYQDSRIFLKLFPFLDFRVCISLEHGQAYIHNPMHTKPCFKF